MLYTVDFETQPIDRRPNYPPQPVSVAVKAGARRTSYAEIRDGAVNGLPALLDRANGANWLCHNASFDVAVGMERLGLDIPKRIDDTLFLAFLLDPYGRHGLKELAQRYLGITPDDSTRVREWLEQNKVVRKGTKQKWKEHIWQAPAEIRKPYNIADVEMTHALFEHLHKAVRAAGMEPAYEREVELCPLLLDMEQQGVPIDVPLLRTDLAKYESLYTSIEAKICQLLGKRINLDERQELAWALEGVGIKLPRTRTGKLSTAKDTIMAALPDGKLKGYLLWRSALNQSLKTFLRPWMAQVDVDGLVHVHWNQVKGGSARRDDGGALSGRLSSEPNFQNLTTGEKRDNAIAEIARNLRSKNVDLPEIRSYVCAPPGYVLIGRDYSQQELRYAAHYEQGVLNELYNKNPNADVHEFVRNLIIETSGLNLSRKAVKNTNFGKIYGQGANGLSLTLGIPYEEAQAIIAAHKLALPSLNDLMRDDSKIGRDGGYIETIGGRRYYVENARHADDGTEVQDDEETTGFDAIAAAGGEEREKITFEYRMLNRRIQGSGADQTKKAMINWGLRRHWDDAVRMILQVHDELIVMAPTKLAKQADSVLKQCMHEAFPMSVPTVTTPACGQRWSEMK